MDHQIPLPLRLDPELTFDRFVSGPNEEAVAFLRHAASGNGPRQIFIHGGKGIGKSHLLQATVMESAKFLRTAMVLDLSDLDQLTPEVFEGLGQIDLVCLDNVDAVSGRPLWEEAFFAFYHEIEDLEGCLILASQRAPEALPYGLPDLQSRMQSGLIFKLQPLSEEETQLALVESAQSIGLDLPPAAARYLMRHERRELGSLLQLLDRLDKASLADQRKLTIPFIKKVLGHA